MNKLFGRDKIILEASLKYTPYTVSGRRLFTGIIISELEYFIKVNNMAMSCSNNRFTVDDIIHSKYSKFLQSVFGLYWKRTTKGGHILV